MMARVKLGAVRLGRAAGKTKFTILDVEDINLVEKYVFEPRMIIDHDGNGAKIYAYAYESKKGRSYARKLQDILWEKHEGLISPGHFVVHKNGITVDNRIDNLQLLAECDGEYDEIKATIADPNSIYYLAIQQLPEDPVEESFLELNAMRFYDGDGDLVNNFDNNSSFYECHFPPCSSIEKVAREFSVCGHCRQVRYCGPSCQQQDWTIHKKHCRPRKRKYRCRSISPER